ncbi:MAG: hypothetical protein EOO04_34525 [Chitinophagaceae bacterium]|nr:MAG: hypothetical protein EOO04_34525 [Chitinophagaceae bacterium]
MVSFGDEDIYLAKLDSSGNIIWLKTAGSKTWDKIGIGGNAGAVGGGSSLSVSDNQELVVSGNFIQFYTSNSPVDTAWFDAVPLTSAHGRNSFVAKYDLSGNLIWIRKITRDVYTTDIAVDRFANIFITGEIMGGAPMFDSVSVPTPATGALFLAKYSNSGALQWVRQATGALDGAPRAVVTDSSGNVYFTGNYYSGSLTFDWYSLPGTGNNDEVFLAKYDSAGSFMWAKRAGGSGMDYGHSIALTPSGNIVLAGNFVQPGTFGNDTLTGNGGTEMFLAEYTATGNYIAGSTMGGSNYDMANVVAFASDGTVYITGRSNSNPCYFGSQQVFVSGTGMILAKGALVTGTDDPFASSRWITFYPNPTDRRLYYQNFGDRSAKAQLINDAGILVYEFDIVPGINYVDLDLPTGNYFMKSLLNGGKTEKITILKN